MTDDPYKLFARWAKAAQKSELNDSDAAALATTDAKGCADVRMVLVRSISEAGFVFFSHQGSTKGKQIAANASAALNFHWKSLRKQVRVRGTIEPLPAADSDLYFSQRPRDHQLNAYASKQSEILPSRDALLALFASVKQKFAKTKIIPRPAYWGGFRLVPLEIEFWVSKRSRQHDRTVYYRTSPRAAWKVKKRFP